MWKLFGNKKYSTGRQKRSVITYFTLIAAGILLLAAASIDIIAGEREYEAAREEYKQLEELYPIISSYLLDLHRYLNDGSDLSGASPWFSDRGSSSQNQTATDDIHPDPLAGLLEINPDFIGWISIDDFINYPVVRGKDNEKYLDRTFVGQNNPSGAIFMDYRNVHGFESDVCILYGHNMKDRTMFAQLHKYREQDFMEAHPNIAIVTLGGEVLVYRVFAAKLVNDLNRAYRLNFADAAAAARVFPNSPEGVSRFLLLSTCTNSSYDFERLLIYAALVN